MALKLRHATDKQKQAAYDEIYPELQQVVADYVPPFFQNQILEKLETDEVKKRIMQVIDDGLEAAENAE